MKLLKRFLDWVFKPPLAAECLAEDAELFQEHLEAGLINTKVDGSGGVHGFGAG